MRKLKFYLIGFIPSLVIVFFILNQKGVSCSGYLPSNRVVAETLSKKMLLSAEAKENLELLKLDESYLKDSIMAFGEINFERSEAQKQPCPEYIMISNRKGKKYEVSFQKCKENVTIKKLTKL